MKNAIKFYALLFQPIEFGFYQYYLQVKLFQPGKLQHQTN